MIDIKLIRENPDLVRAGMQKKHVDTALLDEVITLDTERRVLRQETESLQAEQNQYTAKMPSLSNEERESLKAQLKELSENIKEKRTKLSDLDDRYLVLMRQIPNIPAAEVPEGASDKENVVVKTIGEKPQFTFQPKSHEELCELHDLLDTERAAKIAGAKFYFLKNELVILEMAVLRFAMDVMRAKGFIPMTVPNLVRADALYNAGHFATPEDAQDGDAYQLERDGLYLIGTAEASLVNYHAGEILPEAELPLRYVGISPAYRREAGTYGKETRGLYRVHQFNKVEMIAITRPEDSEKEHEMFLWLAEDLLQKLGLHYQVVLNCGGDLGTPQSKKWDIETWMPGLNKYGETHSCSNDTDWQARSLNLRYRKSGPEGDKEVAFPHTLNNTVLASPRILIPILETYQQEDGSIAVPVVLIPYTGFTHIRQS
jgi:seryl-tRNA synthetase